MLRAILQKGNSKDPPEEEMVEADEPVPAAEPDEKVEAEEPERERDDKHDEEVAGTDDAEENGEEEQLEADPELNVK